MVSTRKKAEPTEKKQLSQLNETSNDFIFGNITNVSAIGNETLEPQTNVRCKNFQKFVSGENSAC